MKEPTVIALGFFDGLHLGHTALVKKTVSRAGEYSCRALVVTFCTSPKAFVTGEQVPLLTTVEERTELLAEQYGVGVVALPFDEAMRKMPWREFLRGLKENYGAVHLVAGHDYRFGYLNEGTPEKLQAFCRENGLGCDIIPCVYRGGVAVSSRHIRALLSDGDVETANAFLGYRYTLCGEVVHGCARGAKELFPTANLAVSREKLLPKEGVYATRAKLADGREYAAVTNIGSNPTVDGTRVSVESFLMDFAGDLYGQTLCIGFVRRLRDERKFESVAALKEQIARDLKEAKK